MVGVAVGIVACGGGPSKGAALEAIQAGVTEDGSCTLPVGVLAQLKMQHVTKGICIPREGADKARACVDALVAAGVTKRMDDGYMVGWPDDVAARSLSDVPAYERRPRNLIYSMCVELRGNLREGRFNCAEAKADKILKVTALDDKRAEVKYEREVQLRPTLPAIDAACGQVTRPPGEATASFVKDASGWKLKPPEPPAP